MERHTVSGIWTVKGTESKFPQPFWTLHTDRYVGHRVWKKYTLRSAPLPTEMQVWHFG